MGNMYIKKCFLFIACIFELNMAEHLLSCSKPHDKKSICFTNDTGYSMPFPVKLDVEVYLHDIVRIDEDMNSLSVRLDLWTNWIDLGLGLSNDEGPE